MAKYNLAPNEVVLLKDESVMHGNVFASYTDELMLTNLNLVLNKKGLFGNNKGIRLFPLNQVKVSNGQAQALLGESSNGSAALEVYFFDGQEKFQFQSGGKKKILAWASKINQALTGHEAPAEHDKGMALPGSELVAGVLKDTFGVFKSRLGAKPEAAVKASGKCRACGAPVSGYQGQAVTCEYCGTAQQL